MANTKSAQAAANPTAAPATASASPAVPPVVKTRPEPDMAERVAIERAASRVLDRRRRFSVKIDPDGRKVKLGFSHSDDAGAAARMLDMFGTCSEAFAHDAFGWLAAAVRERDHSMPTQQAVNAALALVDGIAPANEVEALLAVQMAATHSLAMAMISQARQAEYVNQTAVYGSLSAKLLRAFTGQVEALERLRRGGGQTVRVEHVHVHSGGQAVVGNVATGGGSPTKNEVLPHAKQASLGHADAPFDPLRSTNTASNRVPVPRHAERPLPDAWG